MSCLPLWVKIGYTIIPCVVAPVYYFTHGPRNFLWLSDIALFTMVFAVWFESSLLASMMAVGVLPLEVCWTLDFISGGKIVGLAGYMFDKQMPFYLRALSLFHLPLLAIIILSLICLGYDPNAIYYQSLLIAIVFPLTYLLARPSKENINWVYGLGPTPKPLLYPKLYVLTLIISIIAFVYIPMHFLLLWLPT